MSYEKCQIKQLRVSRREFVKPTGLTVAGVAAATQAETGDEAMGGRIDRTVIVPIKSVLTQDGSPLVNEVREWRWTRAPHDLTFVLIQYQKLYA